MEYSDAFILFLMLGKVAPCWVMECVCLWTSVLQLEESKEAGKKEEKRSKGGRGKMGGVEDEVKQS